MAEVKNPIKKVQKPVIDRVPPPKSRIQAAILFKRILDYLFILIVFLGFIFLVANYNQNIQYKDNNTTIKYHDFWYAIYNNKNELKDIYFYDGISSNFNLIKFIQEKIVLQNSNDFIVKLVSKEKSWYDNYIHIAGLGKSETENLKGYNIRGIFSDVDEQGNESNTNFLTIYSKENSPTSISYCFIADTLSMTDPSAQCVEKDSKNLQVSYVSYNDFYFISIDKEILVYNKKEKKLIAKIETDSSVSRMSTNKEGDIKIQMANGQKEVKGLLFEYQVLKRAQSNVKGDPILLHIKNL